MWSWNICIIDKGCTSTYYNNWNCENRVSTTSEWGSLAERVLIKKNYVVIMKDMALIWYRFHYLHIFLLHSEYFLKPFRMWINQECILNRVFFKIILNTFSNPFWIQSRMHSEYILECILNVYILACILNWSISAILNGLWHIFWRQWE